MFKVQTLFYFSYDALHFSALIMVYFSPLTLEAATGTSQDGFVNFIDDEVAGGTENLSSNTGTAASKNGAIAIKVNGTIRWLQTFDAHN